MSTASPYHPRPRNFAKDHIIKPACPTAGEIYLKGLCRPVTDEYTEHD